MRLTRWRGLGTEGSHTSAVDTIAHVSEDLFVSGSQVALYSHVHTTYNITPVAQHVARLPYSKHRTACCDRRLFVSDSPVCPFLATNTPFSPCPPASRTLLPFTFTAHSRVVTIGTTSADEQGRAIRFHLCATGREYCAVECDEEKARPSGPCCTW